MDQPKEGVRESTFQNLDVTNPDAAWSILSKLQQFQRVPTCTSTSTEHEKNAGDFTRIACMSDTHGKHRKVFVPKCNVLVHAGDSTKSGEHKIIQDVGAFFQEIVDNGTAEKVLCIAGNHDLTFQEETYRENWKVFHPISGMPDTKALKNDFKQSCIYLEDESLLDDDHERNNSNGNGNGNGNGNTVHYYGSPWTPTYGHCWAFMKNRNIIQEEWDKIPSSTDVLITHGPALGHGDKAKSFRSRGTRAGCLALLETIQTRVRPRLHIFGHIHEDGGTSYDGTTLYVNASNCNLQYRAEQPCIVVDLPHDKDKPARVVVPICKLSGEEVMDWLRSHGYDTILPYFERSEPLLDGNVLVDDGLELENLGCKLNAHREWKSLKEELARAIMHLRCVSYGPFSE